jgi:hypothetical protein
MIRFSILEVLEEFSPRRERLIIKKYLYLIEGQEFILVKPITAIIPTKIEPWGLDIRVGFCPG